jgi:hypothetical protein
LLVGDTAGGMEQCPAPMRPSGPAVASSSKNHAKVTMMFDTIMPIIWDPDADAILVRSNGRRHTLPSLAVCDSGFGASLPEAILRAFGLTTVLLENLDQTVYVVALRDSPRLNDPDYKWVQVTNPGLSDSDGFWLSSWLAHRETPLRPWFEQGWMARVLSYVDAVLAEFGRARIGQVSQIKHWALSSVMRIETTKGAVFFKAAPSDAKIEPLLLARLAERWPTSIPVLLAHSPQNNWWLTEDLNAREGPDLTPDERLACIELLARIQIDAGTDPSILRGLSINRYPLEHLAASIPSLLGRLDRWKAVPANHEHWWPLDDEQQEAWCSIGPSLVEHMQALASSTVALGLPLSLIHGDFHSGNMATRLGVPILHDWANGMITHPFFDLATVLKSGDDDLAQSCLTTYLRQWHDAGWDMNAIWAHWQLAKPASALFEVDRALQLCDELGEAHQFTMISVLYGWIRRLLGSILDRSNTSYAWSTSGIAAKR